MQKVSLLKSCRFLKKIKRFGPSFHVPLEIIYRGFLIFSLTALFPSFSLWAVLIISSLLFGLAHTYQGFGNVIRTSLVGLFFAILYIVLGSIIPLIVLHFLIDYVGKIGDGEDV
ncbi:CPBP family intramembrane glutamic endopeptidase [Mesobacillus maritimus]|uniref:CPBP family intramembrane glutamic endopeptidase n=1 Tax=Mesobacillus maritimus TaxID=1643336 RepID=UPI00384D4230